MNPWLRFGLLVSWLLNISLPSVGQPLGNEWIDYGRIHYKFPVVNQGIHRIPYSSLDSVIPNIQTLNPQNFLLYRNGERVPIYLSNQQTFGASDFIEFFGVPNDGGPDSLLYNQAIDQPNPYYSLFSDTAWYFLTTSSNPVNPGLADYPNNLQNLPAQTISYPHTERVVLSSRFYPGKNYRLGSDDLYKSGYEEAEGFLHNRYFGNVADNGSPQDVNQQFAVPVSALYAAGGNSSYRFLYITRSAELHNIRVQLNGQTVHSRNVTGYSMNRVVGSVASAILANGSASFVFSELSNTAISLQQNVVGFAELTYPRLFDGLGRSSMSFNLPADATSRKYFELSNFNGGGANIIVYDLSNGYRISAAPSSGGVYPIALPASVLDRNLVVYSPAIASSYTTVSRISPVVFSNFGNASAQGDYLIFSSRKLSNNGSGQNMLEAYRQYRDRTASPLTGRYDAKIIYVEDLYDQFSYGITGNPLAIRNFIQYALRNWSIVPTNVFLIGKAREYASYRSNTTTALFARQQTLVPTWGSPGSDMLLACKRGENSPLLSIGRLSVSQASEIQTYLDKVREYELEQKLYSEPMRPIADKDWMKHILHFGGGTTTFEQGLFKGYLQSYESIARDTSWGAVVTAYYKNTSAPIQDVQSQAIRSRIDAGVSLITFFGHSSTGAFDINFDEPENYTNRGKYPVMISNGCFAGNIFDRNSGYSERFVLAPSKAAIAFLATSGLSVSSSLNTFTSRLYKNLSSKKYTSTLGSLVQLTSREMDSCCSANNFDQMVQLEMTLHGDPGLSLNQYPKPDYAIEQSSVFFTPANVTPATDTFSIDIAVTNLGKAIRDSIAVLVVRQVAGQQLTYREVFPAPYFRDTLSIRMPVQISASAGFGLNQFSIYIESDRRIDEMSELNNDLLNSASVFIAAEEVIPVYPYEFSIVPRQDVELKASTANPFAATRTYRIEMDTTELFNSSQKISTAITQGGGLLKWKPGVPLTDSTVYYWRVGIDSAGMVANWNYSSFIYINNEFPGWNQSHYYQYLKDQFIYTRLDADRVFRFIPNIYEARVVAGTTDPLYTVWQLNNVEMHRGRMVNCSSQNGGVTFAVIDGNTGLPWISTNLSGTNYAPLYGNAHCSFYYYQQNGFDFFTSNFQSIHPDPARGGKTWSQVVRDFVQSIPDGAYVLMYTVRDPKYNTWDSSMINAILGLGASGVVDLTGGARAGSYVYFTQKGNPSFNPVQVFSPGSNFTTRIDTSLSFTGSWNSGKINSTRIGPTTEWGSFHWRKSNSDQPDYNRDSVALYALNLAGADSFLFRVAPGDYPLASLDAARFPYLRLELETADDTLRTPAQMDYWRVLYKPVPEGVINPSAHFEFLGDTLGVGQEMKFSVAFENISEVDMDSVLTKYQLRDAQNNLNNFYKNYSRLPALDTIHIDFTKSLSSNVYQGINQLIAEANPDNDQPEQYHFNNFAVLNFLAQGDQINPLLDVTFDGRRIMNGDLVSARPNIVISLKDENKYLALDDTSLIDVYLRIPGEAAPRRITYDQQWMQFYPADPAALNRRNEARVEYRPVLLADGKYELIIKNKDRSGNNSSREENREENNIYFDYKISFEVVNKSSVTNVLNYPNPFSNSTRFVFTLTGSEVPTQFMIQIMTVSGKVVREIKKEELGALYIGRNITEYAWDGRDEFGDLLANGVYFYRVVVRESGKAVEKLSSSSSLINSDFDKYFKKGFGKMVILR